MMKIIIVRLSMMTIKRICNDDDDDITVMKNGRQMVILEHLCRNCIVRGIGSTRNQAGGSVGDQIKYYRAL